jgi:hypothetical protein
MARQQYDSVLKRATDMTESIKQAIVLLQIAKNASMPVEPGPVKEFNGGVCELQRPTLGGLLNDGVVTEIVEAAAECKEEKRAMVVVDERDRALIRKNIGSKLHTAVAPGLLKPGIQNRKVLGYTIADFINTSFFRQEKCNSRNQLLEL